jgi:hypothetical protein
MSSFSGTLARLSNTRIFARATSNGTQYLVYQMDYAAEGDIALILPLPTPPGTAPAAVRFIDLVGYPNFFADLEKGFPYTRGVPGVQGKTRDNARAEASFLPSSAYFAELDDKFRSPQEIWDGLPEYHDFGFAVFKIRANAPLRSPVAVEFPTRNPNLLSFPTLHIRDGQAADQVNFDLDLFCQARAGWLRTYDVASSFMDIDKAQGVLDAGERVSRMTVQGMHPNSDIMVGLRA